jgi:hypothetical protein
MNSNPWKVENVLAGLFVTVLGGVILAFIIQDGIFDPNRSVPTPTSTPTPFPVPAPSPIPTQVTNSGISIHVKNELVRPVRVEIEGQYRGNVNPGIVKTFFLDSYPVDVRWETVRQTTTAGTEIGVMMAGSWKNIQAGSTVTVDSVVGESRYFYVAVTNRTNHECSAIINEGLMSEVNPKASAGPGKTVGFGYYRYFSNSNVVLRCENGKTYWWGIRDGKGNRFNVDEKSGYIQFTLNP